jgi:hypothetical protein
MAFERHSHLEIAGIVNKNSEKTRENHKARKGFYVEEDCSDCHHWCPLDSW